MPAAISYLDFDLVVKGRDGGYRAQVLSSPAGQATTDFVIPFSELELDNLILRAGRPRRSTRRIGSSELEAVRALGKGLYDAVFSGDIRACWRASLNEAEVRGAGLRLRLRIQDAPELNNIPWEYLYNAGSNRFVALSEHTPLVRYLELPERVGPLTVDSPLNILVMISSPSDYPELDVELEWKRLKAALAGLEDNGLIKLERLKEARISVLSRKLRSEKYHIFHYIGHGGFDPVSQDGVLVMCDDVGRGRLVSAEHLGAMFYDHRSLRLAVLNSCEGARASRADPFAGVAQTLVQQRVPAVIAMQFEISDAAAIVFAEEFYTAMADGYPVDAAMSAARKAILWAPNEIEWGTPVLYLRAPDGQLFAINWEAASRAEGQIRKVMPRAKEVEQSAEPVCGSKETAQGADRTQQKMEQGAEGTRQGPEESNGEADGIIPQPPEKQTQRPKPASSEQEAAAGKLIGAVPRLFLELTQEVAGIFGIGKK